MEKFLGSRFGPYEIVAPLGAGGMGEVYRAKDTRLKREVALKILTGQDVIDPERQKRFQLEAQAASALNHPNILVVHDVGSENGISYIVSELIEGESLRNVIQKGALPVKFLLDVAVQIADGLSGAHQAGITHRDLKPENIMVNRDSRVKILDFGLAKLHTPTIGEGDDETLSRGISQTGIIRGTVTYMSPEQASGKNIGYRSDQFSFGLILYEMATGRKAFVRNSIAETLSAIINEEPAAISSLNQNIPAPVRWLTERCLAKDPRQRYDSTRDLYHELRTLRDHLSETKDTGTVIKPPRRKSRILFAAIMGVLMMTLLGLGFLAGSKKQKPAEKSLPTFQLLTFQRGEIESARFLPDGNTIVYSAAFSGNPFQIYMIRPERPESQPISLPSASILSISGSGELAIRLRANSRLAVAQLAGGTPREIVEDIEFADWAPDSKNMAVIRRINGVNHLEYPVGKLLYKTHGRISNLRVSPDGDHVAYVDNLDLQGPAHLFVLNRSGEKRDLGIAGYAGSVWSPAGDAIWYVVREEGGSREAGILSSTLHRKTLSGDDEMVSRLDGLSRLYDISGEGRMLLGRYTEWSETRGIFPGDTKERDLSILDGALVAGVSDDGRTLLINEFGAGGGADGTMYLRKSDGSTIRLGEAIGGALSPDGNWALAMNSDRDLIVLPTGAGQAKHLERGEITEYKFWGAFTQDSKYIILNAREKNRTWRLYLQDLAGGKPQPFTAEGALLPRIGNAISPDSKFVIGTGPDQNYYFYPINNGNASRVPGIKKTDRFLGFSTDGRFIYFQDEGLGVAQLSLPSKVYRLDLSSGQKELWKEIVPADRVGVQGITFIQVTPDGKSYFYSYRRTFSQLYLVTGLN